MIHNLQKHNVDELTGVGKQMPITMWCYTICSLGLIGMPPTGPFTSKWYLDMGALNSGVYYNDAVNNNIYYDSTNNLSNEEFIVIFIRRIF